MNSDYLKHISHKPWLMCLLYLALGSCHTETGSSSTSELPGVSPESIASTWLDHYHHNRFDQAKSLSTPETRVKIDALSRFIYQGATEPLIEISNVRCAILPDSSCHCHYLLNDAELGPIQDSLLLTKNGNSWLVSLPLKTESDTPGIPLESLVDSVAREIH